MWTYTTIRDRAADAGRVFEVVQRQPSWVSRAALTAALVVFSGVVLLLVVPAVVIATAVFLVLAAASALAAWARGLLGLQRSGRRNVRVIVRR